LTLTCSSPMRAQQMYCCSGSADYTAIAPQQDQLQVLIDPGTLDQYSAAERKGSWSPRTRLALGLRQPAEREGDARLAAFGAEAFQVLTTAAR